MNDSYLTAFIEESELATDEEDDCPPQLNTK
jgi:hypothetical protein